MKVQAVIFLLCLFVHLGHSQHNCDSDPDACCTQDNVDVCLEPMREINLDEYRAIVPLFDESSLTLVCSKYNEADECIDKLISNCSGYSQFRYTSIEASWYYICEEERDEYLENSMCLATEDLHTDAEEHCTQPWETRVESLNEDRFRTSTGLLNQEGFSSLCNFATTYLQCVYTEVERFCGEDAADWQEGFDDILIQPLLRLIGCRKQGSIYVFPSSSNNDDESDDGLSETVIVIVAVSIALGVIVMVIIAILLLRQNRKDSRYRDPPPPQEGPYVVYTPDGGAMAMPPPPPSYKEKGMLGPEFGPSVPAPPPSSYGAPPSYHPPSSVMGDDHRSVASGRTARSHYSSRTAHSGHVM